MTEPLLSVRDCVIEAGTTRLIDGVSFDLMPGEVLGIVGESGSGKSLTMLGVMGLLGQGLQMTGGQVLFRGEDLGAKSFEEMRSLRGNRISMIFQDPMTSLNPVIRVGRQIAEAITLHRRDLAAAEVRARVIELLGLVGIPDPERRADQFPNEFSGGMRQRVLIAMALANEPDLLIADEPTTALDVTIQAQVMEVLADVRARTGAAMVLITHDLGLVGQVADRVAVIYAGRLVEQAPARDFFDGIAHPYSLGLLRSRPRLDGVGARLQAIPGAVPDMRNRSEGCDFAPRCPLAQELCHAARPEPRALRSGHLTACHRAEALASHPEPVPEPAPVRPPAPAEDMVLEVAQLGRDFKLRRRRGWGHDRLRAVQDVSFRLPRGRTLGLVGESGCGKSTLGKLILRLLDPTEGSVRLKGTHIDKLTPRLLRPLRRDMQVVFQDPYASLDPRMTVHEILAEPLRINRRYDAARVEELLGQVGLPPEAATRRPPEFSGGQRQRIAIARALALEPDVMVLDEAVSALDVSIQAQIVNLLKDLQERLGLAYLFISHDLSVVRHVSDEIAVMYLGRIVEKGPRDAVFDAPRHPYTRALIAAIPSATPSHEAPPLLKGELPNPVSPPSGCPFRSRCPAAQAICAEDRPELEPDSHAAACHFPLQA